MDPHLICLFLCVWFSHLAQATLPPYHIKTGQNSGGIFRIAAGSCHAVSHQSPIFSSIIAEDPKTWLWLGDSVYGDPDDKPGNESTVVTQYKLLQAKQPYLDLLKQVENRIDATWDDHDFGANDMCKEFEHRDATKTAFLNYLVGADQQDPRRRHPGIYAKRDYIIDGKHKLRVYLLDNRYDKDCVGSVDPNEGDMLGKEQWIWLEQSLCSVDNADTQPRVNIFVSGLQVLPQHRFGGENWSTFPNSRRRLLNLIQRCKVRAPYILSGDVHFSELLEAQCGSQRINECTTSGLSNSFDTYMHGDNIPQYPFYDGIYMKYLLRLAHYTMPWDYRAMSGRSTLLDGPRAYYLGTNFAILDIDFDTETLRTQVKDDYGVTILESNYTFGQMDPQSNGGVLAHECVPYSSNKSEFVVLVRLGMSLFLLVVWTILTREYLVSWPIIALLIWRVVIRKTSRKQE